MTREEAIKQIESLFEHCEAMMTSDEPVWSQDCEALKVALFALRGPTREQAEKMRGSMTNREAALKSCKDRLEHLENAPSHHYGKRQRQRAIELEKVKIEALRPITREQVERVWRGEWEEERFAGEHEGWQHRECGRHSTEKTKWCPKCGKAMTDEAVDMVMERLEALRDE